MNTKLVRMEISLPQYLKDRAQAAAKRDGMSLSLFARRCVFLGTHLSHDTWEKLELLSDLLSLSPSTIIDRLVFDEVSDLKTKNLMARADELLKNGD